MPKNSTRASRRYRAKSGMSREQYLEAKRAKEAEDKAFYEELRGQDTQPMNASSASATQKTIENINLPTAADRFLHMRAEEQKRRDRLIRQQNDFIKKNGANLSKMSAAELRTYNMRMNAYEREISDSDEMIDLISGRIKRGPAATRRADRLKSEIRTLAEQRKRLDAAEDALQSAIDPDHPDAERLTEVNARLEEIRRQRNKADRVLASREKEYVRAAKRAYAPGKAKTLRLRVNYAVRNVRDAVHMWFKRRIHSVVNSVRYGTRIGRAVDNAAYSVKMKRNAVHNSIRRRVSAVRRNVSRMYTSSAVGKLNGKIAEGVVKFANQAKRVLSETVGKAAGIVVKKAITVPMQAMQKAVAGFIKGLLKFTAPVMKWVIIGLVIAVAAVSTLETSVFPIPTEVRPESLIESDRGIVADPENYTYEDAYTYFARKTQEVQQDFMVNHNLPYVSGADGSMTTLSSADVATPVLAFVDYDKFSHLTGTNYLDGIDSLFQDADMTDSRITEVMRMYLKEADYTYTYLHRDWNPWEPRISGTDGNDDSVLVDSSSGDALVQYDPDPNVSHRIWTQDEVVGRYNADEVDTYTKTETRTISTYTEGSIDLSFADTVEENTAEETYTTTEKVCDYINNGWVVDDQHPSGWYNKDLVKEECHDEEVEHTRTRYDYTYTVTVTLWKYRTFNSQKFTGEIDGAEDDRPTVVNHDYSLAAKATGDEKDRLARRDALESDYAAKGYLCIYPASSSATSVEYGGYTYDSVGEIQGDLIAEHDDTADEYTPSYSATPTIVKRRKYWKLFTFDQLCDLIVGDWDLYIHPDRDVTLKRYDIYGNDQNEDIHLDQVYADRREEQGVPNLILSYSHNEFETERASVIDSLTVHHMLFEEAVNNNLGELIFANVELLDDYGSSGSYSGTLLGAYAGLGESGETNINALQWKELNAYAKANGLYFQAGTPPRDNWCTNFVKYQTHMMYGVVTHGNGNQVVDNLCAEHGDKFEKSSVPAPGAVFSISYTSSQAGRECGHTGIVTKVDLAAGKMWISDGNYDSKGSIEYNREYNISDYYYGKIVYAVPR